MSQRKSVSFEPDATIIHDDGGASDTVTGLGNKDSAVRHSSADEVSDKMNGMKLDEDKAAPPADDGEADFSLLKKKKKKKKVATEDFDAKIEQVAKKEGEETADNQEPIDEGDMDKGTGIWSHESTQAIPYNMLLNRFFAQLHAQHPNLASSSAGKSFKIPPPQCLREGSKKTVFANLPDICARLKRNQDHVTQYLFAELGTSGSVADQGRLVIKGRFQQKHMENVLRSYIVEYVSCRTCRSADTELSKENRLHFISCNSCGSRRSVATIKAGFSAQIGKRKRQKG